MVLLAGRHAYPLYPTITAATTIKTKQQQKNINIYHQERLGTVQSCALKVLEHPWCLTFALWWLGNLSIFMKIICQTPWISQFESNRIPLLFCKAQPWIAIKNNYHKNFKNRSRGTQFSEYFLIGLLQERILLTCIFKLCWAENQLKQIICVNNFQSANENNYWRN